MLLLLNDGMWNVAGKAGGRGDPIMTGFDGRSFEIIGQAGAIYSLISEKHHKVLTILLLIKLSLAASISISTLQTAATSIRKKPVPKLTSHRGPVFCQASHSGPGRVPGGQFETLVSADCWK